jgi:hypothetical protein
VWATVLTVGIAASERSMFSVFSRCSRSAFAGLRSRSSAMKLGVMLGSVAGIQGEAGGAGAAAAGTVTVSD